VTELTESVRALDRRVDADRLRRDVELLAAEPRSRLRAPTAMQHAEEYVAAQLTEAGWLVERQPFDVRWQFGCTDARGTRLPPLKVRLHRRLAGANLLAHRPGAAGRPTVVVGAHLDTVQDSPGADDNASGVAALLELARLLGAQPDPPAVTLAVFDMEELGLIGARVAARELCRRGPVAGMICLESVGYFATEPQTQRMPTGAGLVFGAAARAIREGGSRGDFTVVAHRRSSHAAALRWQQAAAATSARLSGVLVRDPRPDGTLGILAGLAVPPANNLGRSDHAPFWNRRVPSLMLTGTANFRNRHYHQPTDTPDTLDYPRLAAVTVATAATAARWPA
jgi:acetylornithine deacetylase/succinyl-diaminopimelate desuccinylase-like protein